MLFGTWIRFTTFLADQKAGKCIETDSTNKSIWYAAYLIDKLYGNLYDTSETRITDCYLLSKNYTDHVLFTVIKLNPNHYWIHFF